MTTTTRFRPRILGLFCNWCSYTGADLAGTSRTTYAPSLRIVRVMCSGRIDPTFVLKAFEAGADGVLLAGCHLGDCHYLEGNKKALRRYTLLARMLRDMGIEPERLRLEWISASEGARVKAVAEEMAAQLEALGPLDLKGRQAGWDAELVRLEGEIAAAAGGGEVAHG